MTKALLKNELLHNRAQHSAGKGFEPNEIYTYQGHKAERVTVAGPYAYKPSAILLGNGEILVSYCSTSASVSGKTRGAVQVVRSADGGRSWSEPVSAVDGSYWPMDNCLIPFPDGTILLSFMQIVEGEPERPWQGPWLCKSTDAGKTWSQPWRVDVSAFCPSGPYATGDRSHVVLPDGRFLYFVGVCETPARPFNYVMVSYDQGKSFTEHHQVSQFSGDSSFTLCRDGTIAGALRINADDFPVRGSHPELAREGECVHFMGFTRSTDEGKSWSEPFPITGFNEIPGHLVQLRNGRLLLTYGVRHFPVGVQAVVTDPEGRSWDLDNRIMLAWHGTTSFADGRPGGKNTIGHPYTVELPDGGLLTVYYYCPDPLNFQFEIEGVLWRLPEEAKQSIRR